MKITDKRNTIYVVIILVVLVITFTVSFTFAFVGAPSGKNNINVTGNILDASDALSLTYSGDTNLSLNITMDDLNIENAGAGHGNDMVINQAEINVILSADSNFYPSGAKCNYTVEYHPINVFVPSPEAFAQSLDELTIHGKSLANITTPIVLEEGVVATSAGSNTGSQPHLYTYTFYNLPIDQSNLIGQSPSGKIVVVPGECEKL